VLISPEGLLMTPSRTDTDGFFVAVLRAPPGWQSHQPSP
jgi:hypothetical protein